MPDTIPAQSESQTDFIARYHTEMAAEIPEVDRRDSSAYERWRESRGVDDVERRAAERFSADEFQHVRNVSVFAEHTTKDHEGNLVVYDRSALQAITDRCNHRIADTGDFPPITSGHTPDKDQMSRGAAMPDVLGYSGPFRLGMIGNKDPRWAIFCDEWHHKDEVERLRKLRRRSPEVWLEEKMEDRFLDPIAALGAETPRLDMGLTRFGRTADGRIVEKYTAVSPGPASSFIKSDKYESQTKGNNMLSPEDLTQFIEAFMETEPMQWVKSQMGGDAPMATGDVPAAAPPTDAPPVDAPPAAPAAPPAAAPPAMNDDDPSKLGRYEADDEDAGDKEGIAVETKPDTDDYTAEGSAEDPSDGKPTDDANVADPALMKFGKEHGMSEKERYARIERQNREQQSQLTDMKSRLDRADKKFAHADNEKRQAQRYSRLQSLDQEYAFDLDDEAVYCNGLNDAQFESHVERIVANYSRIPIDVSVYAPELENPTTEKYQRETSDKARNMCLRRRDKGEDVSFDECLEEIRSAKVG